jgi:hypothetical protein
MYQHTDTIVRSHNAHPPVTRSKAPAERLHSGLLPSKLPDGPSEEILQMRKLLTVMRDVSGLAEDQQIAKAIRLIRAEGLSVRELVALGRSMSSRVCGRYGIAFNDDIEPVAARHVWRASLILASRAKVTHWHQASVRLDFIASYFGPLPEKYRGGAALRLGRDLRAIIEGDGMQLPMPSDTCDSVKFDKYVSVPAYCIGERYKAGDHLLYVEEAEPLAGADCVLQVWGSPDEPIAAGYEGKPPHFMVGQLVCATQRSWIVRTAAPHEYTWRLPKKGWGMLGRIVGYRREGKYFRTDH